MSYLDDVPEEKVFFLGEKRIKNLDGLLLELRTMGDETYFSYAGKEHNYFADWVNYVVKEENLAAGLRKTDSRQAAIKVLEERLVRLRKEARAEKREAEKDNIVVEAKEKTEESSSFVVSDPSAKNVILDEPVDKKPAEKKQEAHKKEEDYHRRLDPHAKETKDFLWKHFAMEMAKEFMYGMSIGILVGLVLSKIFLN